MLNYQLIQSMYQFMACETPFLQPADGAFMFGRQSHKLAERVADLFDKELIQYALLTGGIGKDSGCLTPLEIPEAKWQAALLNSIHGISLDKLIIESKATNGGENTRLGIAAIRDAAAKNPRVKTDSLIIVSHPTSARRLLEVQKHEGAKLGFSPAYQITCPQYLFDAQNPVDQQEVSAEILRLAEWPAKGWLAPITDLPKEFVDYARVLKDLRQ